MTENEAQRLSDSVNEPSAGRVYDYLLGGVHNYAIDRAFAEERMKVMPNMRDFARLNRAFLGRAVRFAVEQGIRQFVDIGSGLPTQGNVHEVADEAAPGECRVVYVDNEPIARAHAEILLERSADPDRHMAIDADFTHGEELWQRVLDTGLIDENEPTALLVVALLHFVPEERRPAQMLNYYRDRLAEGSTVALSHIYIDPSDSEIRAAADRVTDSYRKQSSNPAVQRERADILAFFEGLEMAEPGLVWLPEWRPDGSESDELAPEHSRGLAGVGVVPPRQ